MGGMGHSRVPALLKVKGYLGLEAPTILTVDHVSKQFGGLAAVNDISFNVKQGEVVGIMGPNGAGKSTTFNLIAGVYKPTSGKITFKNHDITGLSSDRVCHLGIGRTFQIPQPFGNLTPRLNLVIAAMYGRGLSRTAAETEATRLFEVVGFTERPGMLCRDLAAVALKRLEIARAMACDPAIVLLDEVAAGSNDSELPLILGIIKNMKEMGKTVILVEHVMKVIVEAVDRLIVMDKGSKLLEGKPLEVLQDQKVIDAYFG
jgi:branched-chain amino acid transport system ATP-binding protein